jgi:hypothetical protein
MPAHLLLGLFSRLHSLVMSLLVGDHLCYLALPCTRDVSKKELTFGTGDHYMNDIMMLAFEGGRCVSTLAAGCRLGWFSHGDLDVLMSVYSPE